MLTIRHTAKVVRTAVSITENQVPQCFSVPYSNWPSAYDDAKPSLQQHEEQVLNAAVKRMAQYGFLDDSMANAAMHFLPEVKLAVFVFALYPLSRQSTKLKHFECLQQSGFPYCLLSFGFIGSASDRGNVQDTGSTSAKNCRGA